jgi:hypothetical protein
MNGHPDPIVVGGGGCVTDDFYYGNLMTFVYLSPLYYTS